MNKKGQLETGQTMMILIVFFILIIFALIFFIRFQSSDQAVKQQELNEQEMVEKAQQVYSLGEFSCSYDNVLKYDCLDILKLISFKRKMLDSEDYLYYRKMLGDLKVEVQEIYPIENGINFTGGNAVYDVFPSNSLYKPLFRYSQRSIQIPVVLYNASDTSVGAYYFGLLTVTSYFRVTER
ncbi:hypothetical protein JXM83_06070 [Candidatus Woesearchaeota archaeon]|nr:hypothetical protein [Candidatus Woesearchaeota archaeon]